MVPQLTHMLHIAQSVLLPKGWKCPEASLHLHFWPRRKEKAATSEWGTTNALRLQYYSATVVVYLAGAAVSMKYLCQQLHSYIFPENGLHLWMRFMVMHHLILEFTRSHWHAARAHKWIVTQVLIGVRGIASKRILLRNTFYLIRSTPKTQSRLAAT